MKMTKIMRRLLTMLTVVTLLMSATMFMASAAGSEVEEQVDAHIACCAGEEIHEHEGAAMAAAAAKCHTFAIYSQDWIGDCGATGIFSCYGTATKWNINCSVCGSYTDWVCSMGGACPNDPYYS